MLKHKFLKFLLLLLIIIKFTFSFTQLNININNGIDTSCNAIIYDNGGIALNYSKDTIINHTLVSNNNLTYFKITFTEFDFGSGDSLIIVNTSDSSILYILKGNNYNLPLTLSMIKKGNLQLRFYSNNDTIQGTGFRAIISCELYCQPILLNYSNISSNVVLSSPYNQIQLCIGDPLSFNYNFIFPENNTIYSQSDTNLIINWYSGDGIKYNNLNNNYSHIYDKPGIFNINCIVQEPNGCKDTIQNYRVIQSSKPVIDSTSISKDSLCYGDTAYIISTLNKPGIFEPPIFENAGLTYLPDGNGVDYTSTINVNIFNDNALYINDVFTEIFMDLEHSYLGDLEIKVICPNGQELIMLSDNNGASCYLGEAVDDHLGLPGIPYHYQFKPSGNTYGTMISEVGNHLYTYTNALGQLVTNHEYLPSGSYQTETNFNNSLAGCPLNGNWTLLINDDQFNDDGYIFTWGFFFSNLFSPIPVDSSIILPVLDSLKFEFTNPNMYIFNDSSIFYVGLDTGNVYFNYGIKDSYGCRKDSIFHVFVNEKLYSSAIDINYTCNLKNNLYGIKSIGNQESKWEVITDNISIYLDDPMEDTTFFVSSKYNIQPKFKYSEIINGCPTHPDTIQFDIVQITNEINYAFAPDSICFGSNTLLSDSSDTTDIDSIIYYFDDSIYNYNSTIDYISNSSGVYDLSIKLINSIGCEKLVTFKDALIVLDTPNANFHFTPDNPFTHYSYISFLNDSKNYTNSYWYLENKLENTTIDWTKDINQYFQDSINIQLIVSNENICYDTISKRILIKEKTHYFIPNSFTPNDDGINETYKIIKYNELLNDIKDFSFKIYDKFGELVFSTNTDIFEWDGKYKGKPLPNGTYIYKIGYIDESKEIINKTGHIIILK